MGVLTFTEEGVVEVPEDDLAKWLASDEATTMRPAGSGPDGRWTVEDEKAAFRYLKKNDKLGTEPYDVLADRLVNAGYFSEGLRKETTRKRLAEKYPDASRIDVNETGQAITYFPEDSAVPWQKDAEDRSIYDLSDGSTPKTFKALANGTARAASDETVLYGEEQDPGALQEEMYRSNIMGLVKAFQGMSKEADQAEYEADQEVMGTPGYGPKSQLAARGNIYDSQLGPVPEELLSHTVWPPEEGDTIPRKSSSAPAWEPDREGYDHDIVERTLPDGTSAYVRTKKETPSERAARIAMLEYEARDTD